MTTEASLITPCRDLNAVQEVLQATFQHFLLQSSLFQANDVQVQATNLYHFLNFRFSDEMNISIQEVNR